MPPSLAGNSNRVFAALLVCSALVAASPHPATAGCNLIPGTALTFNGAVGGTNRPFAGPGEPLEIRLRPCDAKSPGFLPSAADQVVTLVFKAPDGTNRVVALANDCAGVDTATCAGTAGVASAVCRAEPGLATRIDVDIGDRRIVFPFPDTDADFAAPDDDLTLTGPVAIAVTAKTSPLPCQLATQTCTTQTGLLACIDELYANDGACGTTARNDAFPHFTALPVANDYAADCFQESPPCTALGSEVRAALDSDGNLLMPFVWRGILTTDQGLPVPRLVRFRAKSPLPFKVPSQTFLSSLTPEGGKLPPILEPQLDPTVADPDVFTAFGSIDAPATTIRVARRHGTCVGGDDAGSRCERNVDCGGGICKDSCVDDPATLCPTGTECTTGACGELFDLDVAGRDRRSAGARPRRAAVLPAASAPGLLGDARGLHRRRQRLRRLRARVAEPGAARRAHRERVDPHLRVPRVDRRRRPQRRRRRDRHGGDAARPVDRHHRSPRRHVRLRPRVRRRRARPCSA